MAEIRRLHVHCISGMPTLRAPETLARFQFSPERALVAAAAGDLVCVPGPIDAGHVAFLNGLGVGPAMEDVLVPDGTGASDGSPPTLTSRVRADRGLLARIAAAVPPGGVLELHPYATTADMLALAEAIESAGVPRGRVFGGTPAAAARADYKHVVRAKAIELGVPVAAGEVVELPFAGGRRRRDFDLMRAAIERQLRVTGRVLVRGSVGMCGSSAFVVSGSRGEHPDEIVYQIGARGDNRVYLIEAMVDALVSPNLHLHLDPSGAVTRVSATDQRWDRPLVHDGNLFPSGARMLGAMDQWARTMAGWLHCEGYAGDVGMDFVEYRDPRTGRPAAFLAEVNTRVNGANYPLALRNRLNAERRTLGREPIEAFASGGLTTRARGFGELADALGPLLFSHEQGRGLVPYATGYLAHGRCPMVALAPTVREALELHAEARAALEDACTVG
jgi:hypothetical protein